LSGQDERAVKFYRGSRDADFPNAIGKRAVAIVPSEKIRTGEQLVAGRVKVKLREFWRHGVTELVAVAVRLETTAFVTSPMGI